MSLKQAKGIWLPTQVGTFSSATSGAGCRHLKYSETCQKAIDTVVTSGHGQRKFLSA